MTQKMWQTISVQIFLPILQNCCDSIFLMHDSPFQYLVGTKNYFVHYQMKSEKCAIDEVPSHMIINCAYILAAILTYLYNFFMTKFLNAGKITHFDKLDSKNYVKKLPTDFFSTFLF